jgi:hypothetical protein
MYARETSLVPKGGYGSFRAKFGKFPDCTKIACIHKSGFPTVAPFWTIGKNTLLPELLTITIFFSGGWLGTTAAALPAKPRTRRKRTDINVRDVFITDLSRLSFIPVEVVWIAIDVSSVSSPPRALSVGCFHAGDRISSARGCSIRGYRGSLTASPSIPGGR